MDIIMKLVLMVVQDKDAGNLLNALTEKDFNVTKLASSGGFLREGNTTIFAGVDAGQVPEVIGIIEEVCPSRERIVTPVSPVAGPTNAYVPYPIEVPIGGAVIFVMDVEKYVKL